ncbi:MAG: hypothetical protein PVH25_13055, partial [Burkholderiales bacterium]
VMALAGCITQGPPVDSLGKTPQQVLEETYTLILQGQYARAQANFSPQFIRDLITNNNSTFIEYCARTRNWRPRGLKTTLLGNSFNDNLWRIKLTAVDGKDGQDRTDIIHDLYMVDGKWTIVFWGDYQHAFDMHEPDPRYGKKSASLSIQ